MLNSFAPKSFPLKKKGEWGEFPNLSILNSIHLLSTSNIEQNKLCNGFNPGFFDIFDQFQSVIFLHILSSLKFIKFL